MDNAYLETFFLSQSLLIQGSIQIFGRYMLVELLLSQSLLIQGSIQMAAAFFMLKKQHVAAPNSSIFHFIVSSLEYLM